MDPKILEIIIERIKQRQVDLGLNQEKFAELLNISQGYLSSLYNKKRTGEKKLLNICAKASIPIDDILLDENVSLISGSADFRRHGMVPVISWVQAGEFTEAVDTWPAGFSGDGDPVMVKKPVGENAFALRVVGDSMYPRFFPGDIIVVDPSLSCETGDYCVVKINNEVTFKKIYINDTEIKLIPLNETYPVTSIPKAGKVNFKIIGRVVDQIPDITA